MKNWHGTIAHYLKSKNAVAYRRVKDFDNCDAAIEWLNANIDHPITIWHNNAAELHNPYLAMCETQRYKDEHKKMID